MSSLVSIVNRNPEDGGAPIVVTVQTLSEGGRERHPNGEFVVQPGKSKDLLIDGDTSLQIDEVPA